LQTEYSKLLTMFSIHCSRRIWSYAQVLITGAILARGQRTVTAVLRVMGLGDEKHFVNYHRVLQRAVWSRLAVSGRLLLLLIQTFAPTGPLLIGGDDTIARRWGLKIAARGIYRDPVRSSQSHFVKPSGLRGLTLMLLVPVPFAQRVWALPFLTLLAPSERYYEKKGRSHKKLTDWLRQALLHVRRWVPQRASVFVADNSYAVIDLLAAMAHLTTPITMVVRVRLDAALYEPAAPRQPGHQGRTRKKGVR
jgi:DDE superfamily endonuclease